MSAQNAFEKYVLKSCGAKFEADLVDFLEDLKYGTALNPVPETRNSGYYDSVDSVLSTLEENDMDEWRETIRYEGLDAALN